MQRCSGAPVRAVVHFHFHLPRFARRVNVVIIVVVRIVVVVVVAVAKERVSSPTVSRIPLMYLFVLNNVVKKGKNCRPIVVSINTKRT